MANVKLNIITATNMQGLIQLENKLKDIKQIAQSADNSMVGTYSAVEIQKTVNAVNTLQHALRAAYDTKLNTVNIEKFNQYLAKSKMSVQDLYINLSRMGATGRQVFMDMTQTTLMMGRSVKQTNALVSEMQTTMKNTVKWGISSGLWNAMLSTISQAWTYVKKLNSDLNDIRIVTGKSADQMERFAKTANKAAKELAVSTRDYTQGALLYYQQGDDEETVKTKTDITAKASNVTGQDMATVSEQLTAVWNGYQVANQAAAEGMQVYEEYVDKLAAVAATTASDLEEQATAMSKVASAAYSMGVGFDDLNAQIATIESVTRQAPESVGTALKTIYARLGDLKVDGVDEFGVKLGEVSSQLKIMGVDILDSNGNMKDMSIIMEDVASKWQLWTREQKQAAAIAMAGKRQYNNLFALFENQDMYNKALSTSMEANGTLAEQQAIAVEDLDSKLQKLSTTTEKLYDALFNEEAVGGIIDAFTVVADIIASAVQGIGGLAAILPAVGGMLLKSFGANIGNTVAKKAENKRVRKRELSNDNAKLQLAAQLGDSGQFLKEDESKQDSIMAKEQKVVTDYYKDMARFRKNMTDEEIQAYNIAMKNRAEVANKKLELQETVDLLQVQNQLTEEQYNIISKVNKGEKITEEEAKQLEILKEKVKQQRLLVEQAKAQVETEQLKPVNVGIEISRKQKTLTMEDLKNKSETAVSGIVTGAYGQNADADDIKRDINVINEVLIEARKNGLQAEQAISFVKETLEKTSDIGYGDSIFNDLRTVYQDMEKDTKAFSENVGNVFDEQIGERLKESLGDDAKDVIEELRKKVVELTKQGKTFEEAYTEAIEGIGDEAAKIEKTLQDIDISNIDLDNADFELKGLLETQELKTAMEGLSSAAGGTMQLFAGFTGVMNSFKSAMDPSLDTTERLSAAFTGLITSGFIIVSAINSITQATNSLKVATNSQTVAEALRKVIMTVIGKLSKQNAQNTANETNQMRDNTAAINENTAALAANEAVEQATQSAMSSTADAATTAGSTMTTMGSAAATSASSTAAASGAVTGLGAAAAAAGVALIGLVAIITTVVIVMEAHQRALEKEAEAAKQAYREQKKLTEQAKEEKDAIDAITNSYQDLNQQYKEQDISLIQLRKQTADLCLQYGQQDLALKALLSDYEELNQLINNAEFTADETYLKEAKKAQEMSLEMIQAEMIAQSDETFRDTTRGKDSFDVYHGLIDWNASDVEDVLSDYNIEIVNGHIYTEDFVKAISENYDEIYKRLASIDGDVAEDLIKAMESVSEEIDEYQSMQKEISEADKTHLIKQYGNNINSVQEYHKALTQVVAESKEYFENEQEAIEWAENALTQNLQDKGIAQEYAIAKARAEQQGVELSQAYIDSVAKELAQFSNSEKSFLYLHLAIISDEEQLEEFLNRMKDAADWSESQYVVDTVGGILEMAPSMDHLSEDVIQSLYQGVDVTDEDGNKKREKPALEALKDEGSDVPDFGYTEEEFSNLSYTDQIAELTKYYNEVQKINRATRDAALEDWNLELENAKEKERLAKEQLAANRQNFDIEQWKQDNGVQDEEFGQLVYNVVFQPDKYANEASIMNAISELYNRESSGEDPEQTDKIDAFKDYIDGLGGIEAATKKVMEISSEENAKLTEDVEAAGEAIKTAETNIAHLENATWDWSAGITSAHQAVIAYTTELQSLSSEYQLMQRAMQEYDEQGSLSVDTLMSLITMSDEMLGCLQIENGQLSINEEAVKAVALARIQNAQAMLAEEYQGKINNIIYAETQKQQEGMQEKIPLISELVLKMAAAVGVAGDAFHLLGLEMAGVTDQDFSEETERKLKEVSDEYEKKFLMYQDIADAIANGDFSSMGDDTSSNKEDERNEKKKNYDDEFDRYWQLNKTIDKTTESIDDLQNAQDNLFGEELQANLAKTNGLLDTQIANYQALYAEQQKEAAELRSILSQSGAAFDATGALTNYAAITEQALATYNQAVQAYNAHLIDDAAFETATTIYETFIENLERYDDLFYGEMIDTINEIEDREREKLENALSGWEAVIEVNLDEDSMARDWNDFISEMNKDFTREFEDIGAELQRIATDVEYFPSTIHTDLNAINTVMQEMNNLQAGLGSTMFESVSQAEEKLRELTEQLMSDAEEMKGLYEEAWDAYLEGIDQAAEKLEKVMQEFENIDAELEYQGELIELIYGPEAYDLMDSLYKGQQKNMLAQIQSLQTQYDTWKQMYEAAEEGSADQVKYYDLMNEAQANLNDSVIEYIELLKSEYSNTVSDILKKVEKEIIGGSTFDDVEKQWDRLMEKSDKYLDNLEGLYEIQSIANDTQAEIADMSDLKDQQKLQTLLDKELKQLREKDRLTKYDLDAAKARLEIAKAEIALEDARASKTSMRLTRGDDGNWSYQYVADADNVASKQQELMDAMNDYYQLTKDAHQESLESMMDLQIKLKEELEEIANSEVLTEEEKYAKMQEIQAYYEEQMTLLAEENELYKQNLSAATAGLAWNLYSQDAINFEAMTAAEQGLIQGLETTMVTSYDNIMIAATTDFAAIELAVVENINDIGTAADNVATINIPAMTSAAQEMANRWAADDGTGIKATITGAIESIKTAMGQYQIKVDGVAKEVGEDFGKQGIQGAIEGATTATQTLIGKVKELCGTEVLNGLSSFKGYVDNIAKAWGDVKTQIDKSTTALDNYIKKKADENKKENTSGSGAGTKPSSTPTTPSTPAPSQPAPVSTQGDGVINTGDKVTLKSGGKLANDSYDTPTLSTPYAGKQLYIQNIVDTNRRAPYHLGTTKDGYNNSNTWVGWVNKDQISGYDTGGYTGEWGSSGRMAFLHEKELILNKEDTKNILAAVNGIRQFSSVESAITKGIASMIMNMAGMGVNANYNTNEAKGNQTEQVFNITAEFPNANNVSEIREAILSLPGLASQQVGLNLI